MDALSQRASNLTAVGAPGGSDQGQDPDVAASQQRQIARAQEAANAADQLSRIGAASSAAADQESRAFDKRRASFDGWVQAQLAGIGQVSSAMDALATKSARAARSVGTVTGEQAPSGPPPAPTSYAQPPASFDQAAFTRTVSHAAGEEAGHHAGLASIAGAFTGEGALSKVIERAQAARGAAHPPPAATRATQQAAALDAIDIDPDADLEAAAEAKRQAKFSALKAAASTAAPWETGGSYSWSDQANASMSAAERAAELARQQQYDRRAEEARQQSLARPPSPIIKDLSLVSGGSVADQLARAGAGEQINDPILDQYIAAGITPEMLASGKMVGGRFTLAAPKPVKVSKAAPKPAGEGEGEGKKDEPEEETAMGATRRVKASTYFPWARPAMRGRAESLSYQRYQILESPEMGLVQRALEPSVPGIGTILTALAGPELAAAAAATAFGLALKQATDAAIEYSKAQFLLTESTRGTSLAGGVGQGALDAQSGKMRGLGIGGLEESAALSQLTRYTTDPAQIAHVQQESLDFARAFGTSLQQAQTMFINASQGDTSAFHQYLPSVYGGDTAAYAEQMAQQKTGGAAARYMQTPSGASDKLSADMEEMWTKMGTSLLPVIEGADKGLEAMIPVLSGVGAAIGFMTTAFGDLASVFELTLVPVGKLIAAIPGMNHFWEDTGKGLDLVERQSATGLAFIDSHTTHSALTGATGFRNDPTLGWGADAGGANVPDVNTQLRNLAALNPQLGVGMKAMQGVKGEVSLGASGYTKGEVTMGSTAGGAYAKLQQMYTGTDAQKEAKLQADITSGKYSDAGVYQPGGPGGASDLSDKQLADTAQAHVSSMRTIAEETTDTLNAVSGVQDVFSKLETFHVDFTGVKSNLDNLQSGILYLQQWWVKVANDNGSAITIHQYDVTKTWLEMVNSMLAVMQQATGVLSDVYRTSGEMPSEGQMGAVVSRVNSMFTSVDKIAHAAMQGAGAGAQIVAAGEVQAWSTGMTALVSMLGSGTDVLGKMYALALPDQQEVTDVVQRVVFMVSGISSELQKAFIQTQDKQSGRAIVDSGLASASALATNADALVSFASAGVDMFSKMRGLYVPSQGDIDTVVDRVIGVSQRVADAIEKQMHAAQQKQVAASSPDMTGIMSVFNPVKDRMNAVAQAANPGAMDPVLKAAGDNAANQEKLVSLITAGVATFTNMRGMHIPDPATIDATTGAVNDMVNSMARFGQDPAVLIKAGKWATDAKTIVDTIGAGVGVFVQMRGMHVPGVAAVNELTAGLNMMVNSLVDKLPSNSDTMLIKAGEWASDAGKIVGVLATGAQVFQGMRFMHVPAAGAIEAFVRGLDQMVSDMMPMTAKYSDPMLVKAKEWADSMGPVVSTLSSGVGVLKGIRELLPPGVGQMAEFHVDMDRIIAEFVSSVHDFSYTTLDSAKEWADDMGPLMQTLSTGADALQKVRDLRAPSMSAISDFVTTFHIISEDMLGEVVKDGYVATDRAKEWGDAMGTVFTSLNDAETLILGMRDLHEPSIASVDSFVSTVRYISEQFLVVSDKYTPDMEGAMTGYGQTISTVMGGLNAAQQLLNKLPSTGILPKTMVDGFFSNLNDVVVEFRDGAAKWKKDMDLENSKFSIDIGDEMDALLKASQFFTSLGGLRVDYRGQVNMFFSNLDHAITEFEAGAETWKSQMGESTHKLSGYMTDEFNALNAALDPMTKVEAASHAQPGMIDMVFNNLHVMIGQFASLADSPELQGTKLAKLQQFSGQMNDVFGAIKNATDAATMLNTPAGQLGGGDFTSVMESFFMRSVPTYAKEWDIQMQAMATSAERNMGRVVAAVGSTGIGASVSRAVGAAPAVPGKMVSNSAPSVYQNCIFLNDVEVGQGADAKMILKALTDWSTKQNGGVPVNSAPLK